MSDIQPGVDYGNDAANAEVSDTAVWPFETDALEHDPLTALRIPVVTSFNPSWRYVAAYLGTSADTGNTFDPPWPFASAERPTDREAQMLVSYLLEHRHYWFKNQGYAREMDRRPLDIDSGWNTVVFIKYGQDDWGYGRVSWQYGHTFVPGPPTSRGTQYAHDKHPGPLPLDRVMDLVHTLGSDEPMQRWLDWKAAHPEVFGPCTRCKGSGIDPEHTASENYGDAVRELETPCGRCQLVSA